MMAQTRGKVNLEKGQNRKIQATNDGQRTTDNGQRQTWNEFLLSEVYVDERKSNQDTQTAGAFLFCLWDQEPDRLEPSILSIQ